MAPQTKIVKTTKEEKNIAPLNSNKVNIFKTKKKKSAT
jgi:hypothetical protein